MTPCRRCGVRGTKAPHGYCSSVETGCRWRAVYRSRLLKEERLEMEAYIEELFFSDKDASPTTSQ
jgi:hypothetical protein